MWTDGILAWFFYDDFSFTLSTLDGIFYLMCVWTTDARCNRVPWLMTQFLFLILWNFLLLRNNKKKVFPPRIFFPLFTSKKVLNNVDGTKILHSHYFPPLSADFPSKLYHHIFKFKLNILFIAHFHQNSIYKMGKNLIFDPEENFSLLF